MSKTEALLVAITAALTPSALGVVTVERDRVVPFPLDELPAVAINARSRPSAPLARNLTAHTLALEIEIHTRGTVPSALADPIATQADALLLGLPDLNGGIGVAFQTGDDWETADGDNAAGKRTLKYDIHFHETQEERT